MDDIHVVSVSTDRADIGILLPIWKELSTTDMVRLKVLLTGNHVEDVRSTLGLPSSVSISWRPKSLPGTFGCELAASLQLISSECSNFFDDEAPRKMLLLAGDRIELLPIATAAYADNIPIAHVGGGDVTGGAIDDNIRHALTKLSHLHFTVNEHARNLVLAMGEQDWRVFNYGAPNIDTLRVAQKDVSILFERFGINQPFRLITIHPVTNSSEPLKTAIATFQALEGIDGLNVFTAPNNDPGGRELTKMVHEWCRNNPSTIFVNSFGHDAYATALSCASVMIGNSSSGIIEAGYFGLPVINIGSRQEGRVSGKNVRHVGDDPKLIRDAIRKMDKLTVRTRDLTYGSGHTAKLVSQAIVRCFHNTNLLNKVLD
ncbi:UDP-N-acetylglucosamine 2-epimerase [Paracoccaceae bacterium]|nr:UDP-N-acetylglucosamine 2-epimerase [Paracoccaceae bacterium]